MKLKRKWPAYCIWVLFIIFDVVMVASSSFFLGLFPSKDKLLYTVLLTVLGIAVMSITTFLLWKICDVVGTDAMARTKTARVIYGISGSLTVIAAFAYRVYVLRTGVFEVGGKMSLYENAAIGSENITPEFDLLSIAYSAVLKCILLFTGNDVFVALVFDAVLFALFMIFAGLAVYKFLGFAASIVFELFAGFMPIFLDQVYVPELSTVNLFLAMFGFELFIVSLVLRGTYKGKLDSGFGTISFVLVGALVGYMCYVDAGTLIAVMPFLFAIFFLAGREFARDLVKFLVLILGAVLTFGGMIVQEAGVMNAYATLVKWATYYFHNLNTFSFFLIYTNYKIIYLVTVIAMSGIGIGFLKSKKIDAVSPWLFSMLLIYVTIPFMGATRMNSQIVVTIYFGFMLSCLACLITTHSEDDGVYEGKLAQEDVEEEFEESEETEEVRESEEVDECAKLEKEIEEVRKPVMKEEKEPETVPEVAVPEEPRYVPEGMVVPQDTLVDMVPRDGAMTARMPKFEGTISLDRKDKRKEKEIEKKVAPKDDFDVPFEPGDDFDI
ncbi:MAG: hypothetical protein E7304_09465 [Butyrivibrio sp.]|jgi:hypothetical protein|uniref:hypothetical protein n=1 Tax=Butyrivibrio sp. TaxID=28121 RepID=UPI001ECBBBD4|nr:hypothetical protein [Butyrivibrio sp.]MBE5841622.1 hypothetical protein [Butyrivibrio sp.]